MEYSLLWGSVHPLSGFSYLPPRLPCSGPMALCSWLMPLWPACREGLCHQLMKSFVWRGQLRARVASRYGLSKVGLWDLRKALSFLEVLE